MFLFNYCTAVYCLHNFSAMNYMKLEKISKLCIKCFQQKNYLFTNTTNNAKFMDSKRQGKIFSKFYGERLAGRKKRWFPTQESTQNANINLNTINIGKPAKNSGSKNNLRRIAVLNKLFMQHITDLLATGEASEHVLNRGLQITKLKISVDFTHINVYWLGNGTSVEDAELEQELKRVSGLLRHELSQLELMGNVPRIHFVRDRTNANFLQITETLDKLEPELLKEELQTDETVNLTSTGKVQKQTKKEFFGANVDNENQLPPMRQDVFGLNHEEILFKILTKMRKTKQAWNTHNKLNSQSTQDSKINEE